MLLTSYHRDGLESIELDNMKIGQQLSYKYVIVPDESGFDRIFKLIYEDLGNIYLYSFKCVVDTTVTKIDDDEVMIKSSISFSSFNDSYEVVILNGEIYDGLTFKCESLKDYLDFSSIKSLLLDVKNNNYLTDDEYESL